jgi:hypothetical protein
MHIGGDWSQHSKLRSTSLILDRASGTSRMTLYPFRERGNIGKDGCADRGPSASDKLVHKSKNYHPESNTLKSLPTNSRSALVRDEDGSEGLESVLQG